jgi:hypothetical protein
MIRLTTMDQKRAIIFSPCYWDWVVEGKNCISVPNLWYNLNTISDTSIFTYG